MVRGRSRDWPGWLSSRGCWCIGRVAERLLRWLLPQELPPAPFGQNGGEVDLGWASRGGPGATYRATSDASR